MKVKVLLKFYFRAEGLNASLDRLILSAALNADGGTEKTALKICAVIEKKRTLAILWDYMDNAMRALPAEQIKALERYAAMRGGFKNLPDSERKLIKRSTVKFCRKAVRLDSFSEAAALVREYYCAL